MPRCSELALAKPTARLLEAIGTRCALGPDMYTRTLQAPISPDCVETTNAAFVTILEHGRVDVPLQCPGQVLSANIDGVVSATVIQQSEETLEDLTVRVQRRLTQIAHAPGQVRHVIYRVGVNHSAHAFPLRTSLCQAAIRWLTSSENGASLLLAVPEPSNPAVRHAFVRLLGDLSVGMHSVAISLVFEAEPHEGQRPISGVRHPSPTETPRTKALVRRSRAAA